MADADELTVKSVVRRCGSPLIAEVDGETVLMSIDNGQYYGLDAIGGDVWRRLTEPVGVDALCRALAETYDGDPAQIECDVLALLTRLREECLIEIAA